MADLRYQVDLDTQGAIRSLNNLKSQIAGFGAAIAGAFAFREFVQVASRFEDLRTTLQLLYKDAQVGSQAFEEIKQFAATSIFAVEDLTATVVKLKAAGLEPTVSLLRLFADTSSVAADSVGALQAITDLYARTTAGGLGLEDLNRLADRGIPVFTILSERLGLSRLEISKVGQTAEGAAVILQALEEGLQDAFGDATAARAGNVSQAVSNFGDAIGNAADAIGQSGLNQGLSAFIKALTDIVTSMRPVLEALGALGGAVLINLAENLKLVTSLVIGLLAAFAVGKIVAITTAIIGLVKALNLMNLVIGKSPIGLLQRGIIAAGAAFGLLSQSALDFSEDIEELENNSGVKVLKEGQLGAGAEDLKEKIKLLNQELNKFKAEMSAVTQDFARYNAENVKALNLETALIGVSREQQELRRAEADINRRATEEIVKLEQAKAKLTEAERQQGRAGIIDATIAKIREQAEADKRATQEAIVNSEARQRARQVELFGIQNQIRLFEDLQKIQDDIAKMTMTEIERKYYEIDAAAKAAARSAIAAEEARIGRPLDANEQRRFYDEAAKGSDRLKQKTKELYDQSRTFSTGWRRAFNEYVENATNAARVAEQMFRKFTQGLEDAIVGFVKTGKFEWKSFVQDMLETLLRSQIQQTMANIFQSMGGAQGGLLGGLGDLLGGMFGGGQPAGSSPQNPMYVVDVAGGAGRLGGGIGQPGSTSGGIFDSIINVGKSAWEAVKGIGTGIGSAIRGIGGLFGGFFANGGMLPAGKFGIVGERGPELITGPANITPMGMGNVTYNINAVDAASFKALVAADPSFIHSVAMLGAQSMPSRR